jgi:hypothetical protein
MVLAFANVVVGGFGLALGGRRWGVAAAVAFILFAAGLTFTALLPSSVPSD